MACLREAGWEPTYKAEANTYQVAVPPEQQDAYMEAKTKCEAEFSAKNPLRPLDDADYKSLYQQELVAMACLEKEGFPPVGPPISEQQYVAEYKERGIPSWQAYSAVSMTSAEEQRRLEEKCPQPSVDQSAK